MFEVCVDAIVRWGLAGLRKLPERFSYRLGRVLGRWVYYFQRRKGVAYSNLKAAFPEKTPKELKRIARLSYEHMGQTVMETIRLPRLSAEDLEARVQVFGNDAIDRALTEGKGAVLLSAHLGNWEWLNARGKTLGYDMKMLVREQSSEKVTRFLNEIRRSHGTEVFDRESSVKSVIRALRGNAAVATAADQSGGKNGVRIRFLRRLTTAPSGILEIARRTGSPIFPLFDVRREEVSHDCTVFPPLEWVNTGDPKRDLQATYQQYFQILEDWIRRHPEQWAWGYKRWKHCFTKTVVFLTDGKKGHEVQLRALGRLWEDIAKKFPGGLEIENVFIEVRYRSPWHRFLLTLLAPLCAQWIQGHLGGLRGFLEPESAERLANLYVDMVVSCGAGVLPVNLLLSRENRAKSIVLMKPFFPYSQLGFDLVIAPRHDAPIQAKEVVYTDLALNLVDETAVREGAKRLTSELLLNGKRTVSLFLGGDTKQYHLSQTQLQEALDRLIETLRNLGGELLVTTSRRTPEPISQFLKKRLRDEKICRLLVIANEKNIEGIPYAMMGCASVLLVSEDSLGMISEAVSSGKRVCILKLGSDGLRKKHRKFHKNLQKQKLARIVSVRELGSGLTELLNESEQAPRASAWQEAVKEKLVKLL